MLLILLLFFTVASCVCSVHGLLDSGLLIGLHFPGFAWHEQNFGYHRRRGTLVIKSVPTYSIFFLKENDLRFSIKNGNVIGKVIQLLHSISRLYVNVAQKYSSINGPAFGILLLHYQMCRLLSPSLIVFKLIYSSN